MIVIGLCGGSGSGKGTVSHIFRQNGIPTVDTDAVYREITGQYGPALAALEREFGREIITDDNTLDRKALANMVFSGENSTQRLARLNEIAHKYILDETRARLMECEKNGAPVAVVDAPVLFESGFDSECDVIVCVVAEKEKRLSRIVSRDNISFDDAERRIGAQMTDDEIISRSDHIICNNSDLESLKEQVISLLSEILDK